MKIFTILCTRDKNSNPIRQKLVDTLSSFGIYVKMLINQDSIFSAYKKGLEGCDAAENDIIIFCHDDIEILNNKASFLATLSVCLDASTGIVGPAGTTFLDVDAIWWNQKRWAKGFHSGKVKHITNSQLHTTDYGPYRRVVALDGLFLAARKETWDKVKLEKPTYFDGLWDFYDIYYTTTAHNLGYKNYAVPIDLLHHSNGELAGRDSWHNNREAFIANTKLPLKI